MTFNAIVANDDLLAAPAMENWRHPGIGYGADPFPAISADGSGIDNDLNLGTSTYRWATIYGVSQVLRDGTFSLLKDDGGSDRGLIIGSSAGDDAGYIDSPNATTALQLRINGTQAVIVDTNSNVGIGNTGLTAASTLELADSSGRSSLTLTGAITGGDGNYGDIIAANSSGDGALIGFRRDAADDATATLFYTSATGGSLTERARFASGGNFGLSTGSPDFILDVNGDVRIEEAHRLYFGGTGAADNDTNLYRSSADTLATDDDFLIASGKKLFISSDTNLYRSAADTLATDDDFQIATAKKLLIGADTNLYRSAANLLKTDASVEMSGTMTASQHEVIVVANSFTVANSTATDITFGSVISNPNSMYAGGSPALITIQEDGRYMVSARLRWVGHSTGIRRVIIRVNSTTVSYSPNDTATPLYAGEYTQNISGFCTGLSAADTLTLNVYQTSGGNLDLADVSFSVIKIS